MARRRRTRRRREEPVFTSATDLFVNLAILFMLMLGAAGEQADRAAQEAADVTAAARASLAAASGRASEAEATAAASRQSAAEQVETIRRLRIQLQRAQATAQQLPTETQRADAAEARAADLESQLEQTRSRTIDAGLKITKSGDGKKVYLTDARRSSDGIRSYHTVRYQCHTNSDLDRIYYALPGQRGSMQTGGSVGR